MSLDAAFRRLEGVAGPVPVSPSLTALVAEPIGAHAASVLAFKPAADCSLRLGG